MRAGPPPVSSQSARRDLDVRLAMGAMVFCLIGSVVVLGSRLYRLATQGEVGERQENPLVAFAYPTVLACLYVLAVVCLRAGQRKGRIIAAALLCVWAANAASISSGMPPGGQVFQRLVAIALVGLAIWVSRIFPRSSLMNGNALDAQRAAEQGDEADER